MAAAITAGALALTGLAAPARAQEAPVPVDLEVLGEQLFAALLRIRAGGQDGLAGLLLSAELLEWRKQHPFASASEVSAHFEYRRDVFEDALTPQYRALPEAEFAVRVVKALLASEPGTAAGAEHIRFLFESTLGKSLAAFDTREDLTSGALRTGQWLRGKGEAEVRAWSAVRRQALEDPAFAQAWNTVIGTPLALDAAASFATLKDDPTLAAHIDIDAILALQGSRSAFLAEARRQFGLVANRLLQESQQARARLVQLNTTCPVNLNGATCTPEQRAAATATAKQEQKEIDAAGAAAKVLGGLVGITDPKAGQKLEKAATALFSIVTAINKYAEKVAGRSASDAIFSLAAAGLAGDVLGAVITLVGLFGESGPSLDQQILQQVAALREEVRALHQEMRESFQRIEAALNVIFDAMMTEFTKLTLAIAANTAALIDVQNGLAEQQLRLEEIAATILTAIGDIELHDARVDVNHYLGYAQTYGQSIPTFGEYTDPENEFHYAATEIATHSAFVVPAGWATDSTVQPVDVLNNFGEAKSVAYLARLAHLRDASVPDAAEVLVNPGVWNFGAQAYSLLQLQNPAYAPQVSPLRTELIALEGQRILDTARRFSKPKSAPDLSGDYTNGVFKTLLQDYAAALGRLANGMRDIRTKEIVVRDEPGGAEPLPRSYDLFGGASQVLDQSVLRADPGSVPACTPGTSPVSRPSNVTFRTVAPEVRLAYHAYAPSLEETALLPDLSMCYDASWIGERTVTSAYSIDTWAKLRVSMRTRFNWAPGQTWRNVRSATYTWPETRMARECVRWSCTEEFSIEPGQALVSRWPTGKGTFEQSASLTTDAAVLSEVRTNVTAFLQGRQKALYERIRTAMYNANTVLNTAVRDLNNAARQLQAYTRLGFPIALGADEILSSVLFGQYPIPANMAGQAQLDITYGLAAGRYACTNTAPHGTPCLGGTFYPLTDQPFLETVGGPAPQPVACAVSTFWVPGLPGDVVGDCLVASARRRLDALTVRLRHHSELLAEHEYVETVPWVDSTLETLSLIDALVRTPPSP